MKWSTIWELTKINILYSNPQSLTALKKKQEKRPKKHFSAAQAMIKQQALMVVMFLIIYVFMFLGIDFSRYPGYFSFYIALFFVMSTLTAFTALYTIFYESNDVKLYVHLPIKASELYLAKVISSLGMGSMFLMPILTLFLIGYWQMHGPLIAIPLALVAFIIILFSSNVLALYVNAWIGKIIVRSPHRKIISTLLLSLSSFGAIALVFFLNFTNSSRMDQEAQLIDRAPIPYFRGFYDLAFAPLGMNAVFHFWLPLALIVLMAYGLVTGIMPKYYQEALYSSEHSHSQKSKGKKTVSAQPKTLKQLMVKHHLATLQDATLLIQTFLVPMIFVVSMLVPLLKAKDGVSGFLTNDYFGVAFLIGIILAVIGTSSSTFVGVGLSLERENFTYLRSLPIPIKAFIRKKFWLLMAFQLSLPIVAYLILGLFLGLKWIIILFFLLGFIAQATLQGQYMYMRDIKNLSLDWQNITQLFTRGGSQWLVFAFVFGAAFIGFPLIGGLVFLSMMTKEALMINTITLMILLSLMALGQFLLKKRFWNQLDQLLAK